MTGFDRVAFIYDGLSRLVFGNTLVKSQEYYLKEIKAGDCILILGGGTGWILESVFRVVTPGEIWFIDASSNMIRQAKARRQNTCTVHFINGTEAQIPSDVKFDVVITHYFLDMFSDQELPAVAERIIRSMSAKGIWLCSDFADTGKWFHRVLLKSMYLFFSMVAGLENTKLPNWEKALVRTGAVKAKEKFFWNGFIRSLMFTVK